MVELQRDMEITFRRTGEKTIALNANMITARCSQKDPTSEPDL